MSYGDWCHTVQAMGGPAIRNDNTRSTVLRAVRVLEVFDARDTELSLIHLTQRSGYPKSTTYRLVSDLVEAGLLERGKYGYRLGQKLFEMGHLVPLNRQFRDAALPFVQDLHDATGMTVNLAVLDGSEIVYVEKLVQRSTSVPHTRAGGRLPAHCTGLGKAIMAFSEPAIVDSLLDGPLVALTPKSLVRPDELRRELAEIRCRHVAFDNEESQPGLFCVASPALGPRGVVGAISVTGATRAEQTRQVAPAVITTTRALSRALGTLRHQAGPVGGPHQESWTEPLV